MDDRFHSSIFLNNLLVNMPPRLADHQILYSVFLFESPGKVLFPLTQAVHLTVPYLTLIPREKAKKTSCVAWHPNGFFHQAPTSNA